MKMKSQKGAAFTEYAILAGLIGSVSIAVLLDFGSTATSAYTAQASVIETQLASAGLQVGGVLGDNDGGIYINTNEPAPITPPPPPVEPPPAPEPVSFFWANPAPATIALNAPHTLHTLKPADAQTEIEAVATITEATRVVSGIPVAGSSATTTSGLRVRSALENRTVSANFTEPLAGAVFGISEFGSYAHTSYFPALRISEKVRIVGITPDGQSIYPTTDAAFVTNEGPGRFGGSMEHCAGAASCVAGFEFHEPVVNITVTLEPLPSWITGGGAYVDI